MHLEKMQKEINMEIDTCSQKIGDQKDTITNDKLDILKLERVNNNDKKNIEQFMRQRDLIQKNVLKQDDDNKKQGRFIQLHENSMVKLTNEIDGYKLEGSKCAKHIYQLEKDKEK